MDFYSRQLLLQKAISPTLLNRGTRHSRFGLVWSYQSTSVAVCRILSGIHLYPVYVLPPITRPWTRQIKSERDRPTPPTNCIRVSYLIVHQCTFPPPRLPAHLRKDR